MAIENGGVVAFGIFKLMTTKAVFYWIVSWVLNPLHSATELIRLEGFGGRLALILLGLLLSEEASNADGHEGRQKERHKGPESRELLFCESFKLFFV